MRETSLKRKAIALLLILMMVLSCCPVQPVIAAVEDAATRAGAYAVEVYTTVDNLIFTAADGGAVSAAMTKEGSYNVYAMNLGKGIYNYSAEGYGTGVIKVTKSEDIYLRVVDYTFYEGASAFKMQVTRPDDVDLVYTSPVSSNLSVKLLVPALGWGTTYRYNFIPSDSSFCSFSGNLWIEKGDAAFEGFKSEAFNLSDGAGYKMGQKAEISFEVPTGAQLGVYQLVKFYRQVNEFKVEFVETKGDKDYYIADVPLDSSGSLYYIVSKEGYVTTAKIFQPREGKIAVNYMPTDSQQQIEQDFEASIISNGNVSKHIQLELGGNFDLWTSRAWQAVNSITANRYVEPDKHYYVVDGDAVTVDDIGTVQAVKEGSAIVAVTYDALYYENSIYSAIKDENIAVFQFTVGGSRDGIKTGLENISDLETFYFAKTTTIDGTSEVVTNDYYEYTFTPSTTSSGVIEVSVNTVCGYPTPTITNTKTYTANSDASFTINLYPGRNIVKVKVGDAEAYHVLHCIGSNVTVENISQPGTSPKADESVKISYTGIQTPQPKLGAIYNPGFGGTVWIEGKLKKDGAEEGTILKGPGVQYDIMKNSHVIAQLDADGNYTFADTRIHLGSFGSATGHLALGKQSTGGTYSGGDSPESAGYYCYLPAVSFTVGTADHQGTADAIVALINKIGKVEYTEPCHNKILKARAAYDSASDAVRKLITPEQLKVLTGAETVYVALSEAEIAKKIQKENIDGKESYALTNRDELIWFQKLVNGSLADGTKDSAANAVLKNDITVVGAVLGDDYSLMVPSSTEQWYPIGLDHAYKGTFDGRGHRISGIYMNTKLLTRGALFGMNEGVIKNLNVGDSYIAIELADSVFNAHSAGVVGINYGTIENCSFEGHIKGSVAGGGIAAENNKGTIRFCTSKGKIEVTGLSSDANKRAGGIAGISNGMVEYCYSDADVKSANTAGGCVGNSYDAGGKIRNCYNLGKVEGKVSVNGIVGVKDTAATVESSYYLDTAVVGGSDIAGAAAKTAAQFKSGEVTYLLGDKFGQMISLDTNPVFNDGKNTVYLVDGNYQNAGDNLVAALINAIGKVGLDGSDNCFSNIATAQGAFDKLSKAEQDTISNKAVLVAAQEAYTAVVDALMAEINALDTLNNDSYAAIVAVKENCEKYFVRGGDLEKITNYAKIAAAETAYLPISEAKIAGAIEKQTIVENEISKEYYIIKNAEEFHWFVKLVNGTLQSKEAAVSNANAILANDIIINKDLLQSVLDKQGVVIETIAALKTPLTSIGTYTGTFDGKGHTIKGLFFNDISANGIALFGTVQDGGIVKNLNLTDTYISAANTGGIASDVRAGGFINTCSVDGKIMANSNVGGISLQVTGGKIANCYNLAELTSLLNAQEVRTGGIVGAISMAGTAENCYNLGKLNGIGYKGGVIALRADATSTVKNCYYLTGTAFVGIAQGKLDGAETASCTEAQLKSGELAYLLGSAYGQMIGMDKYPVANDGANYVCFINGQYVNVTSATVVTMINQIGAVALNAKTNCFNQVTRANEAYKNLTEVEKSRVSNYGNLTSANIKYEAVVSNMIANIEKIFPIEDKTAADRLAAVEKDLAAYIERGGDLTRVTNYAKVATAATEIAAKSVLWEQQAVEKTIANKEIKGQSYYVITNAAELKWFAGLVNGTLLTETAQNAAANAILEADITLNKDLVATVNKAAEADILNKTLPLIYWEKMGSAAKPYTGTFDGAGHAVSGLLCYENQNFVGMFSYLSGTVKNLGITDSYMRTVKIKNCGGITGQVNVGGVVENCKFQGVVTAMGNPGGITSINNGTIRLCSTDVNMDTVEKIVLAYSGGIASENSGEIKNCYSRGNLAATAASMQGWIGGIAGCFKAGKIENCYSICTIEPKAGKEFYSGGIVGKNSTGTTLANSYYIDTISYGIGGTNAAAAKDEVTDQVERKNAAEFADGSVAKALGEAFAQRVGTDAYPEFAANLAGLDAVEKAIANIGQVTAKQESKALIDAARAAYDKLSFGQQKLIRNYNVLVAAEKTYADLTKPTPPVDNTIKVYFTLLGDRLHNDGSIHTLRGGNLETWIAKTRVTVAANSTVGDVFAKVLDENNYTYIGLSSNYIEDITTPLGLTLGQFDNTYKSGWMYTVNGTHPNVGLNDYTLSNNDVIIWHFTDDYTKEEGSEKWGNVEYNKPPVTVEIKNDSVTISREELKKADSLELKGDITLIFDRKALEAIGANKDMIVTVKKVTTPKLDAAGKNVIGNRPVFDIKLKSGGKEVSDLSKGEVTLVIPYTLNKGEDATKLFGYYIAEDGKIEKIAGSKYDSKRKGVVVPIKHLSLYAVGYDVNEVTNKVYFVDVPANHWAKECIDYMVTNGFLKGKTETTFAPADKITRAEFVSILHRMSGDTTKTASTTFIDVKADDWYAKAVAWAINNGITKGVSETNFAPNANITRQDMAVMIFKYAKNIKKEALRTTSEAVSFTDANQIATYAKDAVQAMQKASIINGVKNADGTYSFNPTNNATRAEAVIMLANYIK